MSGVDERLIYASRRKLRLYQLIGLVGAVLFLLPLGGFDVYGVLGAAALTGALVFLEWRIRRPRPELRLSARGLEGGFGLIEWSDVTGTHVRTQLGLRRPRVVVGLRPDWDLLPTSRAFAKVSGHLQDFYRDRLELATGHLDIGAGDLVREIERFRLAPVGH